MLHVHWVAQQKPFEVPAVLRRVRYVDDVRCMLRRARENSLQSRADIRLTLNAPSTIFKVDFAAQNDCPLSFNNRTGLPLKVQSSLRYPCVARVVTIKTVLTSAFRQ